MRIPHPKRLACPIAPHAHPLVRRFFEIAEEQQVALTDVSERGGLGLATLVKWKYRHSPTIVTFEAALNVVGYELRVVPRRDPAHRPGRGQKETM
ncbi:MAG: hypothetical protein IH626_01670 [Rhodospirillales bacterium]|nr:hypothetical protein [Rhodospirillales bacterium]